MRRWEAVRQRVRAATQQAFAVWLRVLLKQPLTPALPPHDVESEHEWFPMPWQRQPGEEAFRERFFGVFCAVERDGKLVVATLPLALFAEEKDAQEDAQKRRNAPRHCYGRFIISRVDAAGLVWHSLFLDDPRRARDIGQQIWKPWKRLPR